MKKLFRCLVLLLVLLALFVGLDRSVAWLLEQRGIISLQQRGWQNSQVDLSFPLLPHLAAKQTVPQVKVKADSWVSSFGETSVQLQNLSFDARDVGVDFSSRSIKGIGSFTGSAEMSLTDFAALVQSQTPGVQVSAAEGKLQLSVSAAFAQAQIDLQIQAAARSAAQYPAFIITPDWDSASVTVLGMTISGLQFAQEAGVSTDPTVVVWDSAPPGTWAESVDITGERVKVVFGGENLDLSQ